MYSALSFDLGRATALYKSSYYYYYYYYCCCWCCCCCCCCYCYCYYYYFFFCPEVLRSPRDLDITNLFGVLSGWSGLVVHRRGEGTGEGHKIVSLDCY